MCTGILYRNKALGENDEIEDEFCVSYGHAQTPDNRQSISAERSELGACAGIDRPRSRGRAEIRIRLATEFAASPAAKRKDHILDDDQLSAVDRFKSKF